MKSTFLLIAIVGAFVVVSESCILCPPGQCPECYKKDPNGECRPIFGCVPGKREVSKKFFKMMRNLPEKKDEESREARPGM